MKRTTLIVIKPDDTSSEYNVSSELKAYTSIMNAIEDQTGKVPNKVVTVYYNDLATYGNNEKEIATGILRQAGSDDTIYVELMLTDSWNADEVTSEMRADLRVVYFAADWVGAR